MLEFRITLPIQMIVLAVVMIVILSLSFSIFTTSFAQNLSNDINADSLNNTLAESLKKLTINAKGPIVSMQNDDNGTWIIWGDWNLVNNASDGAKISTNPLSFLATIMKVKPDNTESITYKIYNFKLDSPFIKTVGSSSNFVFNGTATIKTKAGESSQVPIKIAIIDSAPITASIDLESGSVNPSWVPKGGTISIFVDDKVFPEFGSSPVYGIVKKAKIS
jgi:hypothetical protein